LKDIKILNQFEKGNKVYIVAESISEGCKCPKCGIISTVIHSRYTRKLCNGSLSGTSKEITFIVRKFKCKIKECSQKIFTERRYFADTYSRFTTKIIEFIKILALSTSAEKVAIILSKIGIEISHDSVLRGLKKLPKDTVKIEKAVVNIGIDDFAFKKSKDYCTLICDMDKKIILDILPSRNKDVVSNWLKNYPHIKLVSRDGSITYGAAVSDALPEATQVSDKFHLIKNLLDYTSKYARRKYPKNLIVSDVEDNDIGNLIPNINKKNNIREEKITAKWTLMTEIKEKHKIGAGIRELAREYSMSRETIRKYLIAESPIYWKHGFKRGSKLDKFKELIIKLSYEEITHQQIYNILKEKGYDGSRSALSAYMSRNDIKRSSNKTLEEYKNKPKPRTFTISSIIRMICKNSINLKDDEIKNLEELKNNHPEILVLRDLIEEFKNLFKSNSKSLETWIDKAKGLNLPEINSFVLGIERDISSVKNSTSSVYTNGLLEGMVNKVKGIKRTSYGRCKFELLRLKVLNFQEIYG
jgi:transposase